MSTETPAPASTVEAVLRKAQPVGEGFGPYVWSPTVAEVAARRGLQRSAVLKFDQNTPPVPGVPQVPLGESMAHICDYPEGAYSDLHAAAAEYVGVDPRQIVVGAGADDLILLVAQVFLGPGRRTSVANPTYAMYRIAGRLRAAEIVPVGERADLHWRCNPNNPTGELVDPAELADLARRHPDEVVAVDEAYFEFGGETVVPWVAELPNLVAIRTLSKAFGYASLRVGFAVAHPETAALLGNRRAPAPIAGPAAHIAAAALRKPRFVLLDETLSEVERVRGALLAAGYDCPPVVGNFVWVRTTEPLEERLEQQGLVVRGFDEGIRITMRRPSENDVLLRALGAQPGPPAGRHATVMRTTRETALRVTLSLDGEGRARVDTGIGFLDHLLALWAFHSGFDLEVVAGGDLEVDEHHVVEDVLAALGTALDGALGDRSGLQRYGSVVLPMDEARAVAAVDLVRRPHAEIELAFTGDRVGALATSLVVHALERFAVETGCTVHLEASGADDHHVAEAAFKALGRSLQQAASPGGEGVRSTKGAA